MSQSRGGRRRRPDAGIFISASGSGEGGAGVTELAAIFMFTSLGLISSHIATGSKTERKKFPPEAVLRAREGVINAPLRRDRGRSGRSFSHRCSR